jgi:hypothetical protein
MEKNRSDFSKGKMIFGLKTYREFDYRRSGYLCRGEMEMKLHKI